VREFKDSALAEEFRRAPRGEHSPRLSRLLTMMQATPVAGKTAWVLGEDGAYWLARIPTEPRTTLALVSGPFEDTEGDVQAIASFEERWQAVFGEAAP
jgi:hypothetical protein